MSAVPTPTLGAATVPAAALLHRRTVTETGIVHLGLGNFHRAHQAVYTAAALAHTDGPWGILGVAGRSAAVADAMRAQDLRYSVVEIAPDRTRVTVPAVTPACSSPTASRTRCPPPSRRPARPSSP